MLQNNLNHLVVFSLSRKNSIEKPIISRFKQVYEEAYDLDSDNQKPLNCGGMNMSCR